MTLFFMVFFHIVDDFYLQGILASMKQKSWWEKNAPDKKYSRDWLIALIMHGFSWTFMIMLPIAYQIGFGVISIPFCIVFTINLWVHIFVDHLKANCGKINLLQDQLLHLGQIILTYIVSFVWILQ